MSDITGPIEPFELTQGFGGNPAAYSKFGLKGHNGWDLKTRFPDTPEGRRNILSSWLVEFYRKGVDPEGYGNFFETVVKLKNTWKLTFAHCTSIKSFKTAKEGDLLGVSGATGNVTGPHLHLTVKPIRIENGQHINLEQNNGYFGAINPQQFFDELREFKKSNHNQTPEITPPTDNKAEQDRNHWWNNQVKLFNAIIPDVKFEEKTADSQVDGAILTLKEERQVHESSRNDVKTLEKQITDLKKQLEAQKLTYSDLVDQITQEKVQLQNSLTVSENERTRLQNTLKSHVCTPTNPQSQTQVIEEIKIGNLLKRVLEMFGVIKKGDK